VRLAQRPIEEADSLRGALLHNAAEHPIARGTQNLPLTGVASAPLELRMVLQPGSAKRAGVRLGQGAYTEIGYDASNGSVYIDRTRSGESDFHPQFAARHTAPASLRDGGLSMRILVDRGSVTVFAGEGEAVLTDQVFPTAGVDAVSLFSMDGDAHVRDLNVWSLKSIWKEAR
jgi:fructan beta-fructosidase